MKINYICLLICSYFLVISCYSNKETQNLTDDRFYLKTVDLKKEHLAFYWKGNNGKQLRSFTNLKNHVEQDQKKLTYAMNGGMYLKDGSPQGLFIENGMVLKPLDTIQKAFGNFYLQPNGVFGINKSGVPVIETSGKIKVDNLKFATQSGPMLIIDGKLHPAFNKGSKNVHIRNAVGVLPNGKLLFAISKQKINFYDLATFFKKQGCKNALYLDGFVSKIYDPQVDVEQMDGKLGILIAITE